MGACYSANRESFEIHAPLQVLATNARRCRRWHGGRCHSWSGRRFGGCIRRCVGRHSRRTRSIACAIVHATVAVAVAVHVTLLVRRARSTRASAVHIRLGATLDAVDARSIGGRRGRHCSGCIGGRVRRRVAGHSGGRSSWRRSSSRRASGSSSSSSPLMMQVSTSPLYLNRRTSLSIRISRVNTVEIRVRLFS